MAVDNRTPNGDKEPSGNNWMKSLLIWAGIIGSAVVLYVILDGFDLGIGMLFPFARDDKERDQMMASIAG